MPLPQYQLLRNLNFLIHLFFQIEDAACALGSRYRGAPIGAHGSTTCFSFHPRKLVTTGEGGALTTGDTALAERCRSLVNHGASVSDLAKHAAGSLAALRSEHFAELGYNYRMTDLQGAVGLAQMERLDEVQAMAGSERKQRDGIHTSHRAAGPMGDANRFAQILLMVLPSTVMRMRDEKKRGSSLQCGLMPMW